MATAAERTNHHILPIGFDYDVEPAEADVVEITTDRKVQKLTAGGGSKRVGVVAGVRSSLKECTVATPFRENRIDRIAGEDVTIGPFVFGPANKVYQYTPGAVAQVAGTATGTKTVVQSTSDKVKINYQGSQTFTLTAGSRTMAQTATEINDTAAGFVASVDADGHLVLTGLSIGVPLEVEAISNDAYTLLGLTAAVTRAAGPSHDPNQVAGLIIVGGDEGDAVETLEY